MNTRHLPLYGLLNTAFAILITMLAAAGDNDNPRLLYLCLLFAICSSPLLLIDRLNGRYAILSAFLPLYFVMYGLADVFDLLSTSGTSSSIGALSAAEALILAAAALMLLGYLLAVRISPRPRSQTPIKDWAPNTILIVGLIFWIAGLAASWVWQIEVLKRAFEVRELDSTANTLVNIGRLVHPLGLALLSYRVVVSRSTLLGLMMIAILAVEFAFGFVADSKELAIRGLALLLAAKFLLEGRVPVKWLAAAAVLVLLSFPLFQAYRTEVLGYRHVARGDAAMDIGKYLDLALSSSTLGSGDPIYTSRSFFARASLKPTLEIIVARVGEEAAYQNGKTLTLLLTGFVPRAWWPEKPDVAVGQLFNRELHISTFRDVFISVSQLGDLYWNFGWMGACIGMPLIGFLLGIINGRCDLSQGRSVTRFLLLAVTLYLPCLRFESGIAMCYVLWVRSLVAIGLLHLLFARRRAPRTKESPHPNMARAT